MNKRWEELKNYVLGKKYDLSVASVDSKLIKKLNKRYRKKNESTSVLSFPLSETEGEILLNTELAKKEKDYIFIHSLLHLKGYIHGKKMEEEEERIIKKFHEKKYYNRD
jgi:rRNA maturation RNase YbeY